MFQTDTAKVAKGVGKIGKGLGSFASRLAGARSTAKAVAEAGQGQKAYNFGGPEKKGIPPRNDLQRYGGYDKLLKANKK